MEALRLRPVVAWLTAWYARTAGSGQCCPALEPGPIPGRVLSRYKNHNCRRPLTIDDRQFLGEKLSPQLNLVIGIVKAAHPLTLQRLSDLLDILPLCPGK
jgi:hypothetical protein